MALQYLADDLFLDPAEARLAVGGEDISDTSTGPILDHGVGVDQRTPQRFSKPTPDGGFPRAGQPDQHGLRRHLRYPDSRTESESPTTPRSRSARR